MDEVWGQASGSATQPEHLLARPEGQLAPQGPVPLGSAALRHCGHGVPSRESVAG